MALYEVEFLHTVTMTTSVLIDLEKESEVWDVPEGRLIELAEKTEIDSLEEKATIVSVKEVETGNLVPFPGTP